LKVSVNLGYVKVDGPVRAVYKFPSQSREGLYHYVFVFGDGRGVQCSCEGWQYHRNCRHIHEVPYENPSDRD